MGVLCFSLICYAFIYELNRTEHIFIDINVHSSFSIILARKRKLVALLLLSYRCLVFVNVLWLFLTLPWVGLLSVIVVF